MSNPHLGCGDARGWGVEHEIEKCIILHKIIVHNCVNVHQIPTTLGTEIHLNVPFTCQITAQLEHAFVFYEGFCKVYEQK